MTKKVYYDNTAGRLMERDGSVLRIFWTPQMLTDLKRYYPTTKRDELSAMLGIGVTTIERKARELGLKKDAAWLKSVLSENAHLGRISMKKNGTANHFPKGHVSPAQFKKGHVNCAKACVDVDTGIVYKSRVEAAKSLCVSEGAIRSAIRTVGRCRGHRIRPYPNPFPN